MPEVTIVIPVYKPNLIYLKELFQSISNQQFEDYNIVVSDDGNEQELILESLPLSLLHKVKYIRNRGHHGIFGNLNNGLKHAGGKYVQIFCQDDVMLPSFIGNNYACFERNPDADLVFSATNFITPNGDIIYFDYSYMKYVPTVLLPKESNNYFLYFGCMPGNLSSVMFRKQLLDRVGFFNESYEFAGDFEFWIRTAQVSKIIFSKERNLNIRNHSNSASISLGTLKRYNEIKLIHKYLIEHSNIPFNSQSLKRFLHINLFRATMSFLLRKIISTGKLNLTEFKILFDGEPYSLWIAFLAFIYPFPIEIKKLKRHMEVNRE